MAVNTLVTSMIVYKIFNVFRVGKIQITGGTTGTSTLGSSTYGSRLRSIIFILIESGTTLFSIQLIRLTVTILMTNSSLQAFDLIVGINQMLNVIIKNFDFFSSNNNLNVNVDSFLDRA